jgi:hypothetical protein
MQVAGRDGEGIVQRTNGDAIVVVVGIERCSVKKIRRLTACRFESGPGHHSTFSLFKLDRASMIRGYSQYRLIVLPHLRTHR